MAAADIAGAPDTAVLHRRRQNERRRRCHVEGVDRLTRKRLRIERADQMVPVSLGNGGPFLVGGSQIGELILQAGRTADKA